MKTYPHDLLRLNAIAEFVDNAMRLVDPWERGHGLRCTQLVRELAKEMGICQDDIPLLTTSARIHDVGKIGIPDSVLHRRKFTVSNMDTMKGHPKNGYDLIKDMDFDERVGLSILQHHEWWDGSGYPAGLKGEEISLWARMISIVDNFDAISSERASHKARSVKETIAIMRAESGTKFDPELLEKFIKIVEASHE